MVNVSRAATLFGMLKVVGLLLATAAHAAPAVCKLTIKGASSPGQLSEGSLTCSGGEVVVAVGKQWSQGGFRQQLRGVRKDPAGCGSLDCLITICGETDAVFNQPVVNGVTGGSLQGVLCVAGASRVRVYGGRFDSNQGAPAIWVGGTSTLLLANSTLHNNTCVGGGCGLLAQGAAKVTVDNTDFVGNAASGGSGGALAALGNATVSVVVSGFTSNSAGNGGACYAAEAARLTLDGGSAFANNTASRRGPDLLVASPQNLILGCKSLGSGRILLSSTSRCAAGEVVDRLKGCVACPPGTYSLGDAVTNVTNTSNSKNKCERCPTGAQCPGGAVIVPQHGYWKSSPSSGQVHRCPRPDSCAEGGVCREGYSGYLCGSASQGYGTTRPFISKRCMSAGGSIGLYLSGVLALFGAICLMVMSTLQDNARCIADAAVRREERDPKCTCPFRCGFVGVLVRHVQHLMVIGVSILTGIWPTGMLGLFSGVGWFFSVAGVSTEWASVQCLAGGGSKVPWAVWKVLAGLLTPLAMCFAVSATVLSLRFVLRRMRLHMPNRPANMLTVLARATATAVGIISVLIVTLFFWPSLVYTSLSWFACIPLDRARASDPGAVCTAARGYWVFDIHQACYTGWHKTYTLALGIPVAIILLGTPLNILSGFYMHRAKLHTEQFKAIVGFMYHNYKDGYYYWEPINAIEIAIVVAISCFSYTLGSYYSLLLLNMSFGLFFLLQLAVHPHAYKELHRLQLASLGILCFTTYIGLTMLPQAEAELVQPPTAYGVLIGVIGCMLNVGFVLYALWEICRLGHGKVVKVYQAVVRFVRGIFQRL